MKKKMATLLLVLLLLFPNAAFVQGASSPYRITVNLVKNIVTVYSADDAGRYTQPVRAFYCSSGQATPAGTFRTTDKYVWRPLFGGVYGQYATRITGSILFHSVPYYRQDKSTLEYLEYNKLGSTASAGCIRLTAADAKWIYDNCPSGTTVEMYRENRDEPLQPPSPPRIDTSDARRGWDPTDPSLENPWGSNQAAQTAEPRLSEPQAAKQQEERDDLPPEWLAGLMDSGAGLDESAAVPEPDWGPTSPAVVETRLQKQEEASLAFLRVQAARANAAWAMKGILTDTDCCLTAQDAKQVFAHLGITLLLPRENAGNEARVRYQREVYQVPVLETAGQTFYSLRDLSEITGVAMDLQGGNVSLYLLGEEIRIEEING